MRSDETTLSHPKARRAPRLAARRARNEPPRDPPFRRQLSTSFLHRWMSPTLAKNKSSCAGEAGGARVTQGRRGGP